MGWRDFFFKKNKSEEPDPLKDMTLSNLQPGYFVDYDMKTWEVEARHYYDWGEGDYTYEWQLKSHDDTIYLEKSSDDEEEWSVSRPISFARLGSGIRRHILENEDPPDEIAFEGKKYYLDEFGGGYFYRNGTGAGDEFLSWDYIDDAEESFISIEQWGEEEFEASLGNPVEEYQFTNILPGERHPDPRE